MATATRPMTADEFLNLPDDGMRHELVRGELTTMALPGGRHGKVAMKVGRLVGNHAEANGLGDTFAAETGFLIARDPDTLLGADVGFVRRERLALLTDFAEHIPFGPDLVVEVLSPTDRPGKVAEKTRDWLAAEGVRLVWNIDPEARTITVHRSGEAPVVLNEGDILDGDDVLPGFRCRVGDLFA